MSKTSEFLIFDPKMFRKFDKFQFFEDFANSSPLPNQLPRKKLTFGKVDSIISRGTFKMGKVNKKNHKVARDDKWANWTSENIKRWIREIFEAKKGMTIYHIISRGKRWGLLREGCKRMYRIYDDKQRAVDHATQLAQKNPKWRVVVHKKDASMERSISPDDNH